MDTRNLLIKGLPLKCVLFLKLAMVSSQNALKIILMYYWSLHDCYGELQLAVEIVTNIGTCSDLLFDTGS